MGQASLRTGGEDPTRYVGDGEIQYGKTMTTVFISYSHIDASTADELASVLADLGISHFRDVKDINWGNSISSKVRSALDDCAAVLVIVSPGSLKSHWVPYEIGYASALRKIILPFLTHPSLDVPHYISDLNYTLGIEKVRDYFANSFTDDVKSVPKPPGRQMTEPLQLTLNDFQMDYLMQISKPRNEGAIYGDIHEQTGRDVAPYQEAIDLFQQYGLMRYSGGNYQLTSKGWRLADQLWALKILDTLDLNDHTGHKALTEAVGLTDGQTELDELKRHVDALENRGLVEVSRTMRGWEVRVLQAGVTERKHHQIDL
ncbi:MAG: toll/interleukin-1 receptor domain-containing protein [Planctomycetia bacterium]|nr:toll/interleukin-1 receptor domain-containing protein [Planctomycetia bacterium]